MLAPGALERITAKAPATCGAAIEVPLKVAKPPGTDELMDDPGAKTSMKAATFEKLETISDLVVEPTLIALEMHAGAPIAST